MGIMRLCKNYSTEIKEAASKEALERNTCSFKYFNILLKQIAASGSTERSEKIIRNENVRVRSAYVGGGIRA
ncbi:MAG: hypothetical protein GX109_00060 [Bacteroidales bacterium]|nr:hypothetical protein [Bacteroidales bacterium]